MECDFFRKDPEERLPQLGHLSKDLKEIKDVSQKLKGAQDLGSVLS